MKSLRLIALLGLVFELVQPAWAQQTISGTIIRSGTAPLSTLAPSGATTNQVPEWSGSSWTPATLAAGTGLALTFAGGTFTVSLATPVSVANGGTGQTSYTDGQLLIGDSSTSGLDKAALTAGSGITVTNGHGSITIAASGGGSGNPTDGITYGSGGSYSLTQAYANTGIAPVTLSGTGPYLLNALVNLTDTSGGDDVRAFLYNSTQSYMVPWSEQRITSSNTVGSSSRNEILCSVLYTPPASGDTIQVWAANATSARGAVIPYFTRITAEQVSGSSSQTQQSNTFPSAVTPVSHYDFSTLSGSSGSNISSISDTGSAGLTLSSGTTKPTLTVNAWNGLNMATFATSTSPMTTTTVPTASTSSDMFCICSITASNQNNGFAVAQYGNGPSNAGSNISVGDAAGSASAYTIEGILSGTFIAHQSSLAPQNGFVEAEVQISGSSQKFYVNGTLVGTAGGSAVTPSGIFHVGSSCILSIGEVILYNSALSTANQSAVTNYLLSKWGI